jgi:hypothetical protein
MNIKEVLAKLKSMPNFASAMGFLPSAVVEGRVHHLNPVQKLYTYVFKLGGCISNYQYTGNDIKVEIQVPFPGTDGKQYPVTVYVELKP